MVRAIEIEGLQKPAACSSTRHKVTWRIPLSCRKLSKPQLLGEFALRSLAFEHGMDILIGCYSAAGSAADRKRMRCMSL
jgi:hypothetical protein